MYIRFSGKIFHRKLHFSGFLESTVSTQTFWHDWPQFYNFWIMSIFVIRVNKAKLKWLHLTLLSAGGYLLSIRLKNYGILGPMNPPPLPPLHSLYNKLAQRGSFQTIIYKLVTKGRKRVQPTACPKEIWYFCISFCQFPSAET